ncbi:MAG: hypothetical protein KA807_10860 [Prolixibacteraceae bacterium]|nr:hypothetical protein [Prolixibacteraceae bacterium]
MTKTLNDYESFLTLFSKLKQEINNSPMTLEWVQTHKPQIRRLCAEINNIHRTISKKIATNPSKVSVVPRPFNRQWKEYNRDYFNLVKAIGDKESSEIIKEFLEELRQKLKKTTISEVVDELLEKEKGNVKRGSTFDPIQDDPVKMIHNIFLTYHDMVANDFFDYDEDNYHDKAIGAWDFFKDTIGIKFNEIYKRWKNSPHIYFPDDYRNQNIDDLIDLYHEAVKSYIFGNNLASLAICRALLENVLINYFHFERNDLDKIIATAEIKYPYFRELNLHKKRKMVNRILHNYKKDRPIKDNDILDFLHTLKSIIQKVPVKH